MEYNLLKEQWIPVKMTDGTNKDVSLREAFEEAHNIEKIDSKVWNFLSYTTLRFLTLFAFDMYMTQRECDFTEEISAERFDMDTFDKYVELCRQDGCTFNLLDREHPFLQGNESDAKTTRGKEFKKKTVFTLSTVDISGERVIFNQRIDAKEYERLSGNPAHKGLSEDVYSKKGRISLNDLGREMPLKMYIQWLLYQHSSVYGAGEGVLDALARNQGYRFTISGENLFKTIISNCHLLDKKQKSHEGRVRDKQHLKPMWRWNSYLEYANLSPNVFNENMNILNGMFFPVRCITPVYESVNENNKTIAFIYYNSQKMLWRDEKEAASKLMNTCRDRWNEFEPFSVSTTSKKSGETYLMYYRPTGETPRVWLDCYRELPPQAEKSDGGIPLGDYIGAIKELGVNATIQINSIKVANYVVQSSLSVTMSVPGEKIDIKSISKYVNWADKAIERAEKTIKPEIESFIYESAKVAIEDVLRENLEMLLSKNGTLSERQEAAMFEIKKKLEMTVNGNILPQQYKGYIKQRGKYFNMLRKEITK